MQTRTARVIARIIGVLGLGFAAFGLWYNTVTMEAYVSGAFRDATADATATYFDPAFLVMSGICVACFIALAFCGVQFLRLSLRWVWLLIGIAAIEIAFIPIVGRLWLHPDYGMSIGAATGV